MDDRWKREYQIVVNVNKPVFPSRQAAVLITAPLNFVMTQVEF